MPPGRRIEHEIHRERILPEPATGQFGHQCLVAECAAAGPQASETQKELVRDITIAGGRGPEVRYRAWRVLTKRHDNGASR